MNIALVICAIFVFCAIASINCIQNGQNAIQGQFPYQVLIKSKADNIGFCGGAIINQRFVLTSNICTTVVTQIYEMFNFIDTIITANGTKLWLEKWFRHPEADLALLRTSETINFTPMIQPVGIPMLPSSADGGVIVTVSGYGTIRVSKHLHHIYIFKNIQKPKEFIYFLYHIRD